MLLDNSRSRLKTEVTEGGTGQLFFQQNVPWLCTQWLTSCVQNGHRFTPMDPRLYVPVHTIHAGASALTGDVLLLLQLLFIAKSVIHLTFIVIWRQVSICKTYKWWLDKEEKSKKITRMSVPQSHLNESIPQIWRESTDFWWHYRNTEALGLHCPEGKRFRVLL